METKRWPNRTKYFFGELKLNESKTLSGDYRLIRVSANGFCIRHGVRLLVTKKDNLVEVLRYK